MQRLPRLLGPALHAVLLALAVATTGCVKKSAFDAAVGELQLSRSDAAQKGARVTALAAEVARLGAELQARDAKLAEASTAQAGLVKNLDELATLNAELSERLRKAGQSVELLATERGTLNQALADTRARLEELRKQQAAAEARAGQFRELVLRFQKLADAGKLKVITRDGRMLLELPNDVLFDSGKTELKDVGQRTLVEIAGVLKTMPDRKYQVAGHTDNVKIRGGKFASNWELSTARAVKVAELLVDSGVAPRGVSAAGYGEFAPVGTNDTPEGRAKNRRIEIDLVPNLEELVKVPGAALPASAQAAPAQPPSPPKPPPAPPR